MDEEGKEGERRFARKEGRGRENHHGEREVMDKLREREEKVVEEKGEEEEGGVWAVKDKGEKWVKRRDRRSGRDEGEGSFMERDGSWTDLTKKEEKWKRRRKRRGKESPTR